MSAFSRVVQPLRVSGWIVELLKRGDSVLRNKNNFFQISQALDGKIHILVKIFLFA